MTDLNAVITAKNILIRDEEVARPLNKKIEEQRERLEQVKELAWRDLIKKAGLKVENPPVQTIRLIHATEESIKATTATHKVRYTQPKSRREETKVISKELYAAFRKYLDIIRG